MQIFMKVQLMFLAMQIRNEHNHFNASNCGDI